MKRPLVALALQLTLTLPLSGCTWDKVVRAVFGANRPASEPEQIEFMKETAEWLNANKERFACLREGGRITALSELPPDGFRCTPPNKTENIHTSTRLVYARVERPASSNLIVVEISATTATGREFAKTDSGWMGTGEFAVSRWSK